MCGQVCLAPIIKCVILNQNFCLLIIFLELQYLSEVLVLDEHFIFKNRCNIYHIKSASETYRSVQFRGMKYCHTAVQPSPPPPGCFHHPKLKLCMQEILNSLYRHLPSVPGNQHSTSLL